MSRVSYYSKCIYLFISMKKQTWGVWEDGGWRTLSQPNRSLSQFLFWINTLTMKKMCQGTRGGLKKL